MFFNNLIFSKQCKPMVWCFDYNFNKGVVDHYVSDITTALDSAKCYFETYPFKVQNSYWLIPILKSFEFEKNELLRIHNRYYYPFGSPMDGRTFSSEKYRFGFNGQEKDDEVSRAGNTNKAMFWEYDTRLGRRWNTDPKPQVNISDYAAMGGNPISYIDHLGNSTNPIYSKAGDFLGTDDKGLQGEGIIMDKNDFTQGMTHTEAIAKGTLRSKLPFVYSNDVLNKIDNHISGLEKRPDYKGYVTPPEGIDWAKQHPNLRATQDDVNYLNAKADDYLYLDVSKMDFGRLTKSSFNKLGIETEVSLLNYVNLQSSASINTTYALGRTRMTLLNDNGYVAISQGTFNAFDWDYGGSFKRDVLIFGNRLLYGLNNSHGVPVKVYGTGKLNNYKPYTGPGSGVELLRSMDWRTYQ